METTSKATVMLLLFNAETNMLLGRGGQWVSLADFQRNPPTSPEQLLPPATAEDVKNPDPGPGYKCIGGQWHVCDGIRCSPLGVGCG